MKGRVMEEVKTPVQAGFLNRIDEIIMYSIADEKSIWRGIADIMLKVKNATEGNSITTYCNKGRQGCWSTGLWWNKYSARPAAPYHQTLLEDKIAERSWTENWRRCLCESDCGRRKSFTFTVKRKKAATRKKKRRAWMLLQNLKLKEA